MLPNDILLFYLLSLHVFGETFSNSHWRTFVYLKMVNFNVIVTNTFRIYSTQWRFTLLNDFGGLESLRGVFEVCS